jgi:hypothetical protein
MDEMREIAERNSARREHAVRLTVGRVGRGRDGTERRHVVGQSCSVREQCGVPAAPLGEGQVVTILLRAVAHQGVARKIQVVDGIPTAASSIVVRLVGTGLDD